MHQLIGISNKRPKTSPKNIRNIISEKNETIETIITFPIISFSVKPGRYSERPKAKVTLAAVIIDAKHLCVASRGVKDDTSATVTSYYGGKFNKQNKITELHNYLNI